MAGDDLDIGDHSTVNSKLLILFAIAAAVLGCDDGAFGPGIQDFRYPVAGNYELIRTSEYRIEVVPRDAGPEPSIPSMVVEIAWDRTFVLAKQQLLKRRSPNDPKDTFEEPAIGHFSYWILDTSVPMAYGPLTPEEFNKKRVEMKISDELRLRDVNCFRR